MTTYKYGSSIVCSFCRTNIDFCNLYNELAYINDYIFEHEKEDIDMKTGYLIVCNYERVRLIFCMTERRQHAWVGWLR